MAVEVSIILDNSKVHTLTFTYADRYEETAAPDGVTHLEVYDGDEVVASFRHWSWAMLLDAADVEPDLGEDDGETYEDEYDPDEDDEHPLDAPPEPAGAPEFITVELVENLPLPSLLVPATVSYDHADTPGSNGASAGGTQGLAE